jgi:hypothetical protein
MSCDIPNLAGMNIIFMILKDLFPAGAGKILN